MYVPTFLSLSNVVEYRDWCVNYTFAFRSSRSANLRDDRPMIKQLMRRVLHWWHINHITYLAWHWWIKLIHHGQSGWHNPHCKIATGTVPCTILRKVVWDGLSHLLDNFLANFFSLSCNLKKIWRKKKKKQKSRWLNYPPPMRSLFLIFFSPVRVDFAWHLAHVPFKVHLLWVIVSLSCNLKEKTREKNKKSRRLNYPPPMLSLFPIFFPLFASISRDIWHIYHSKCIDCG